jgi:hypothetical protein
MKYKKHFNSLADEINVERSGVHADSFLRYFGKTELINRKSEFGAYYNLIGLCGGHSTFRKSKGTTCMGHLDV